MKKYGLLSLVAFVIMVLSSCGNDDNNDLGENGSISIQLTYDGDPIELNKELTTISGWSPTNMYIRFHFYNEDDRAFSNTVSIVHSLDREDYSNSKGENILDNYNDECYLQIGTNSETFTPISGQVKVNSIDIDNKVIEYSFSNVVFKSGIHQHIINGTAIFNFTYYKGEVW